jgi:hypothetical protein
LVELGAEVVLTVVQRRQRNREIARVDQARQKRERELLRRRTADRIRLAKLKYRAKRAAEEEARRRLEQTYNDLRWEIDANPYGEEETPL